jgi:radical SAM protein with 4Fe4S-binding SPASM domain
MTAKNTGYLIEDSLRHPLGRLNWLGLKLAYMMRWKKFPFLPTEIDVEPNNTCNFKCAHCQVTYWDKKPAYFNREIFSQLLNQIPSLMRVKLQGMGEPLLNKELLPMLQAGEERGIRMYFNTNGSINDPVKAQQLAQLDRTHINYSIDGATAETFTAMRPGSRFNQILENIRMLIGQRHPESNLVVSAWTVVTQKNIRELPQIVRLVKQLGLDNMTIQPHLSNWGKAEMLSHTNDIEVETESAIFATEIASAQSIATEVGIELDVNQSNRFCRDRPCPWAWKSAYIAANGDVVPCCVVADAAVVKMGNVFEQDFKDIWNSPGYQELRERISNHDLPEYCKHCYLDPS